MTAVPRWRALPRALLVVLLLLAATGCRVGVDIGVEAGRDGSGVLTLGMRADAEALERGATAGVDPLGPLVEAGEALRADGWSVRDRSDDLGSREVQVSTRFADPADLDVLVADLVASFDGAEVRPLESLGLVLTEDRVRVEGAANLQPTEAVADFGVSPEQAVDLLRERDALDYRVRVTLPGEVLEHNGTLVGDTSLEWRVGPGERVEIFAEGVRPTGPDWLRIGLISLVATAVIALLAVALLMVRRRRMRARRRAAAASRRTDPGEWGPPERARAVSLPRARSPKGRSRS